MTSTTRERATRAVGAHAPELVDVEIIELGQGLGNAANAVGDLVVRIGPGGTVGREARRLEAVAARLDPDPDTPVRRRRRTALSGSESEEQLEVVAEVGELCAQVAGVVHGAGQDESAFEGGEDLVGERSQVDRDGRRMQLSGRFELLQ